MARLKRRPGRPKVKNPGRWNPKWRCYSCGEFKYETQFHRKAPRSPHALRRVQTMCKDCIRNYQQARRMEQIMGVPPEPHQRVERVDDGTKRCSRCGETKPYSEFQRYGNGYQTYCRPCLAAYKREWNARQREARRAG